MQVTSTDTHTVFVQQTKGWPGSSFQHKNTEFKVRRVLDQDRNETQIEVLITEVKRSGRAYTVCSSFCIPGDSIELFAQAITHIKA